MKIEQLMQDTPCSDGFVTDNFFGSVRVRKVSDVPEYESINHRDRRVEVIIRYEREVVKEGGTADDSEVTNVYGEFEWLVWHCLDYVGRFRHYHDALRCAETRLNGK